MSGPAIKTVIVGGGRAARELLELITRQTLKVFTLEILCVVDPDLDAPGVQYADEHWWPTVSSIDEAIGIPGLELIVELTGDDQVLADLYQRVPAGVRVMDHQVARIFWDVYEYDRSLSRELRRTTELQQQVEEERRQLQRILDSLPDVVMVTDPQRRIIWANQRFAEVTGTSTAEARGRSCWCVLCRYGGEEAPGGDDCPAVEALRTRQPVVVTKARPVDEFLTRYYLVTVTPVLDEAGKVIQLVENSHEITTLMQLMRETEESERLFRNFVESASTLISIKDHEGHYVVVNEAAASVFGKSPRDFMGRTDAEVLPAGIAALFARHDAAVRQGHGAMCFEETFEYEGESFTWRTTRFPLHSYLEEAASVCAMARDITEEKRLQAQLLQSTRLAAVGKAVGGLAHDIKNILNGFQGGQYVLNFGVETEDFEEIAKGRRIIERSIDRISAMVRNMLAYSKARTPTLEVVAPGRLLAELGETMRPTLAEAGVQLILDDAQACGELRLDLTMIDRVLMNLVSNAIDACNEKVYGEGEQPTVTLRARGTEHDCILEIEDNGVGMTEKVLRHIFQQFFSTKGARGTGFGMPVSQKLVEEMGGHLEVDSTPGRGTVVRLRFPRVTGQTCPTCQPGEEDPAGG